jgi:hypothetical protein
MPAKAPTDLDRLALALAQIEEAEMNLRSAHDLIREMFADAVLPKGAVDA